MGDRSKIDWCDASWNPVSGCKHGCEYCYARSVARRFGCKITGDMGNAMAILDEPYVSMDGVKNPYPYEFLPTFHRYRLGIPQTWKRPRTIFVCSMADLFGEWVDDEIILEVFQACREAPQHRYLFLTKNPVRYVQLGDRLPRDDNFWYGTTTTGPDDPAFFSKVHHTFLSIEPILERFGSGGDNSSVMHTGWTIIGAETGNRKDKVVPEKDWITDIVVACRKAGKPVFMKESLRELMAEDFIQEYPWKVATQNE